MQHKVEPQLESDFDELMPSNHLDEELNFDSSMEEPLPSFSRDDENYSKMSAPKEDEYWTVKNGKNSLFSVIVNEDPIEVKYFEPSVKGICHILNDEIFPVLIEDLGQKVSPPETIRRGRRTFYCFE